MSHVSEYHLYLMNVILEGRKNKNINSPFSLMEKVINILK